MHKEELDFAGIPAGTMQRQAATKPRSMESVVWHARLRRGRPRQVWMSSVYEHVLKAFGDGADSDTLAQATPVPEQDRRVYFLDGDGSWRRALAIGRG